ncbi:hypothetical protein UYSO10_0463 [Kosakonia radicincitans]|nr:hypothetical protein UYSO10_0463 [Kosakonia radicincitans]
MGKYVCDSALRNKLLHQIFLKNNTLVVTGFLFGVPCYCFGN